MVPEIDRRKFIIGSGAAATLASVGPTALSATQQRIRVVGLKVDQVSHPLGLENLRPRLSWRLESDARNVRQSAYRIWVSSDAAHAGDLWDSGKIDSSHCFDIEYGGRELKSRQRCQWRVQVWDEAGQPSAPSEPSEWEMGLLDPKDWIAQWLAVEDAVARADRNSGFRWIWKTPASGTTTQKFHGSFDLPSNSRTGTVFVCAALATQIRSLSLDGAPIERGDVPNLSGEWLTLPALAKGRHVLEVEAEAMPIMAILAALPPPVRAMALFARLELESGEVFRVASGREWKTSTGEGVDVIPLNAEPWPATTALQLRRDFSLSAKITQARLYATALGVYEARLNGRRVGDALLTPEIAQYQKRLLYRAYDVTELLQAGKNVLGLTVGDGWYAGFEGRYAWGSPPRRAIAQLEVTLADGRKEVIATGPGWRMTQSPILSSELRRGEVHDARLEQPGWDTAAFDAHSWEEAEIAEAPPCRLVAQVSPPIRATQVLQAQSKSEPKPGIHVIDFGQSFAGWCRLRVAGKAGTRIELRFAEEVSPSGEIDQSSMGIHNGEAYRELPKTDVFVLKGTGSPETFEPKFSYRGFRYVQIRGLPQASALASIEGIVIHSDLPVTGQLRCDSPLIMHIWRNVLWTQLSNFVGFQTDNPTREWRSWLGDKGVFADAAAFNMDICALLGRQLDDARDDQMPNGAFPNIAPSPNQYNLMWSDVSSLGAAPAWADAPVILAWTAWRRYGDTAVIAQNWDALNRYVGFIREVNPDYLWRHQRGMDFGDWLAVGDVSVFVDPKATPLTPPELIGTAYWAHSTDLLAQMSEAIGKHEDARRLREELERIRKAFNEHYVTSDGKVGSGSQTSYVLALKFGLLSPQTAAVAAPKLAADVRAHGVALTTGILGTQFLLDVLADAGFGDLAYGLLLRTDYPSWGYMIQHGATAIWENWKPVAPPMGDARNQPALGSVGGFLYRRVAGIDADSPGFKTIVIRPLVDARVKKGGGDYDSIMGRISTDWAQNMDGSFTLDVAIPANTTAQVYLPSRHGSRIEEGRHVMGNRPGLRLLRHENYEAVIEIGSGTYHFRSVP